MTSRRKTRSNARRPLVRTEENALLRDLDPESAKWLRDLRGKERRQGVVPPVTYTPYTPPQETRRVRRGIWKGVLPPDPKKRKIRPTDIRDVERAIAIAKGKG